MADKDFVIKNGLVVGDTATINGVQIDPSGATSNQVLKFDGTKFTPASEGDISGTVYSTTIGDGTNSTYVITHGFGTRNVLVVIRNAASPYEVINARWEATTTNTITVDFSSPVASETVTVSVYGAVTGISTGSSYYQTIGNGTDSSFTLTHNFNTRDVVVTARNAASPYEVINVRWEAETTNTVLVDFSSAPSSNSVRVGVYATVSGTAVTTIDDLSDVTIASVATGDFLKWNGTTWVNDAIDLGTDTTGNYMSNVTAGNLISITHTPGEGSSAAIGVTSGTSGQIIVANSAGVPTWVSESGDVTISDTGVTAITSNVIVNADINTAAAIAHSKLANATAGQVLLGATTTGVVTATTISGDITINGAGVATIAANSVALGTDTTGNYVADVVAGTGITVTHTPGEGSSATIAIGQAVGTSDSPTFASVNVNGSIVFEGTTANEFETTLSVTDPTADRTITLPNVTGTVITTGDTGTVTSTMIADGAIVNADINASAGIALSKLASGTSGQVVLANGSGVPTYTAISGDITVDSSGVASIAANSVALGTDTTGNYVSSLVAGTGVALTNNSGEGATPTIAIGQSVATSATPTFASITTTGSNGLIVNYASGDEGGEILLAKPVTNTSISGTGIIVDVYQNKLRFFEQGGSARGAFVDLTTSGASAASPIALSQSTGNSTSPVFSNLTVSGSLKITTALEIASVSATAATGTINIDFLSNPVVYYTANATANWTLNIRGNSSTTMNTVMSTGDVATVTFMAQQGATAYYPTVYQIDGTAITPKWQGGTAPSSGNALSIDTYAVTIVKTAANTYTAFASQTRFA